MRISEQALASGVTIVVPCYNESGAVEDTVRQVARVCDDAPFDSEMVFVNDGSRDDTGAILDRLEADVPRLRVVHNGRNIGYGASLKRGIASAKYDKIVITDADGTYPNERIPDLVAELADQDMVIGARIGANVQVPLIRRPAKWALLQYARWMAQADIKDINSGLRAVWTRHVWRFWAMLPDRFSFTTTITLASHVNRLAVKYVPIDYHARVGQSSIKPIQDTLNFFGLVFRTVMYFKPLQVLGSSGLLLIFSAIAIGVGFKLAGLALPDLTTISLFSTGLIFLGLGLLGDLINARRVE